jgi:hypothetical protein
MVSAELLDSTSLMECIDDKTDLFSLLETVLSKLGDAYLSKDIIFGCKQQT